MPYASLVLWSFDAFGFLSFKSIKIEEGDVMYVIACFNRWMQKIQCDKTKIDFHLQHQTTQI